MWHDSEYFLMTGETIPVTVIEVLPNRVVQVKTKDNDCYCAIQVTTGAKKPLKVNKAISRSFC